jgi:NADH-quinone oxidoreductase subunit H
LAEYANIMAVSTVGIAVFFGGWNGIDGIPLPGFVWYLLKLGAFIFVFIWIRATLPRYRYDQLMRVGWKFMFPLAIANIFLTGLMKFLFL